MVRSKTLLVLLMSLWLPLQGLAAVIMPYCQHSLASQERNLQEVDHGMADAHAAHRVHRESAKDDTGKLLSACDDCGNCHLSAASTLPSPALPAIPVPTALAPVSTMPALAGIVPHGLNRPPLLA